MIRRLLVGLIVFVIGAPAGFIGFAMALMVAEFVIFPTATLALTVVTALIASWAADGLGGDGRHSDLHTVVRRNLAWGVIPAAVALASPWLSHSVAAFLPHVVVLWTVIAATRLAFRYRRTKSPKARRLAQSAAWLGGAGLTTTAIIVVASLSGLTGT